MHPVTRAAIDVGTNSVRLLVATAEAGKITERHQQEAAVTGLGRERLADGSLCEASQSRTLAVMKRYKTILDLLGITDVNAATTSAVRSAPDGPDFVARARVETGISLAVIDGAEEGALTFKGATSDIQAATDCLVIDIGGGSTEFSWGKAGNGPQVISLELGCVRLRESLLTDDPPGAGSLEASRRFVAEVLVGDRLPEKLKFFRDKGLAIAVAGTPTSLVAIALGLEPYDPEVVHGRELGLAAIDEELARLSLLSLTRLAGIPGLQPDRAPTIVAGALILSTIMETLGLAKVRVSERDILDGLILA